MKNKRYDIDCNKSRHHEVQVAQLEKKLETIP
jgi:hypothetical protein